MLLKKWERNDILCLRKNEERKTEEMISRVCIYIADYFKGNWELLIFPLVVTIIAYLLLRINHTTVKEFEEATNNFARKVLIIFLMVLVSVFLFCNNNPLLVVIIMGFAGEIMHLILIPIVSCSLVEKNIRYGSVVKKEYKKWFSQKKRHCKSIWTGRKEKGKKDKEDVIEQEESKRIKELTGCATVTLLPLSIYSFVNGEAYLGCVLLSFLFGKYLWFEGGVAECLVSILVSFIREIKTVVLLELIWCLYYFFIVVKGCKESAFYWGLLFASIFAIVLLVKEYRKKGKLVK